ncbi:MAG: hypothetical protein HQ592_08035 [Planctomycetes bacterium]|nr:hypothetical protein [Planctomycetota bacterium]
MMKMLLSCCAGCAVMLACIAYADIPDYVDFHAIQSDPFVDPNQPTWSIEANKFKNDAPVWEGGGTFLSLLDKSHGFPKRYLWLEIAFASASDAAQWMDDPDSGSAAPYWSNAYGYDQDQNYIYQPVSIVVSSLGNTITWEWVFVVDPFSETIEFGFHDAGSGSPNSWGTPNVGSFYYDEDSARDIERLEVALYAVPAPASLLLCGIGIGCTVLIRRFRR